jgi:hypothetical protein
MENSWITKARDAKEEMMPTIASLMPRLDKSLARKASATSRVTRYSKVHWAI